MHLVNCAVDQISRGHHERAALAIKARLNGSRESSLQWTIVAKWSFVKPLARVQMFPNKEHSSEETQNACDQMMAHHA